MSDQIAEVGSNWRFQKMEQVLHIESIGQLALIDLAPGDNLNVTPFNGNSHGHVLRVAKNVVQDRLVLLTGEKGRRIYLGVLGDFSNPEIWRPA